MLFGQRPSRSTRKEGKQKANVSENKPFLRDLVLLSGPDDQVVPRQGTRLALNERGHVISGCRFTKSQSMMEVERAIIEAFDGKIPPGVDIELLVSVHSRLVVPSLAPGQHGIDGAMLQRLYRNKPVYIRPNQQLFDLASYGNVAQQTNMLSSPLSTCAQEEELDECFLDCQTDESNVTTHPHSFNFNSNIPASHTQSQHANFDIQPTTMNAGTHPPLTNVNSNHPPTDADTQPSLTNVNSQPTLPCLNTQPQQANVNTQPIQTQAIQPNQINVNSNHPPINVNTQPAPPNVVDEEIGEHEDQTRSPQQEIIDVETGQVFSDMDEADLHLITMYTPMLPKTVTVHRSTIRKDLTEIFTDPSILNSYLDVVVIDARGEPEKGKGKGVILDVLTHFWDNCFMSLAVGRKEKTPFIRHDMQKREWQAIARILVYGYKNYGYFPLQLSFLFMASCLFGEECITTEFLLATFKEYIPAEDQDVLDQCLGDSFDKDAEDVSDFLSSLKCFRVASQENIKEIINELAHQELIQKPRYIVNCWAPMLHMLQEHKAFQTFEDLKELYKSKTPTAKKIIKLFRAEPSNDAERESLAHLKRFVKS
ncbi:uncharacterized protein LOC114542566 [Dendronephthya gigantea]|uniref:uncharacterized protein LOC114542566 n=1 Tax=Dendronephthya gigantea TaxID=151771 RepID=UPI00106B6624|nr:uncharacterized protein LOC114542566 [Dendronephthya gigantea]